MSTSDISSPAAPTTQSPSTIANSSPTTPPAPTPAPSSPANTSPNTPTFASTPATMSSAATAASSPPTEPPSSATTASPPASPVPSSGPSGSVPTSPATDSSSATMASSSPAASSEPPTSDTPTSSPPPPTTRPSTTPTTAPITAPTTTPTTTPSQTPTTVTTATTATRTATPSTPPPTTSSPAPSRNTQTGTSTSTVFVTDSSGESSSPTTSISTLRSTVIITTTDSQGQVTTSTPSLITQTSTSTGSNGALLTVTQIVANPTLSPDNQTSSKTSAFFHNTGAVAGVFVLVGLAAASMVLWVFFAVRRRRRHRRIEHDTAVSATLAAAGFNRAPLDGDEEDDPSHGYGSGGPAMSQVSGSAAPGTRTSIPSVPSPVRTPSGYWDTESHEGGVDPFNPYAEYIARGPSRGGYAPARTSSPPPDPGLPSYHDGKSSSGHAATPSAGSIEPLLAASSRGQMNVPSSPPPPPPRNSARLIDHDQTDSVYSSESTGDDRLDPGLRQRQKDGDSDSVMSNNLRDDADYSRPVLGVRNMPDGQSAGSLDV